MSVNITPGKRLTVEDILLLAGPKPNQIAVDEHTLRKADQDYPVKETSFIHVDVLIGAESQSYDTLVVRVGLIYRLYSMMALKSPVRSSTIKALENLINYQITPYFSSSETAGEELIAFLAGKGYASTPDCQKILAIEAFSNVGIQEHIVTVRESSLFIKHPFLAVGTAFVVGHGATNFLKVADPIVALSCEAAGVKIDGFDSSLFEVHRQHRGQMLSAGNLKMMLEGSKRGGCNKSVEDRFSCFLSAPQIVGPCHEAVAIANKVFDIELNSSESSPLNPSVGSVFDATQIKLALFNLTTALNQLSYSSAQRASVLSTQNISSSGISTQPQSSAEDTAAFHALLKVQAAFGIELHVALSTLNKIELEETQKKNLVQTNVVDKEDKGDSKNKPQSDDSNLTAEQLAKVEAKRKAKAEKAAAKAAAKEQRKSGLVLGAGSTMLRSIALQLIGADTEDPLEDKLSVVQNLLFPIDLSENNLFSLYSKVLEQLNIGGKRKPKIAKGARDFTPEQMRIREQAFNSIRKVFKRHGGVEIDTPVFELKEVLTGKYGEDSKLIYDLADQGGELLSLRYDLTVPFARFLAMNSVGNIKRYHIAKVYRRDNPQLARGRYREFYQCDFDIAGSYSPMVPDAEVITVATEILSDLPVGRFLVKLNHRKILDAIFEICGVPSEKFRPICSAVDKLDKMSWEDVKAEMVDEKGLSSEVADRISAFVLKSGKPFTLWNELMDSNMFGTHKAANDAMNELKVLFGYLEAMGSLQYISFDLSLARGLDYYTGVIYEVVLTDGTSQVGSIAAGGRYDNLVGMFSPAGVQTPCVGVSIGIERVFTIMEKKAEQLRLLQQSHIQVFIASIGANLMHERMKIAQALWSADISAEYSHLDNPKFKRQLDDSLERGIPYMVVFGQDEINKGVVKVKNMKNHVEVEIPREQLVQSLLEQGCTTVAGGSDGSFISAMKKSELIVDA